jgi:hypothetical protein
MDELVKHLSNIYAMDGSSLAVIAILCAVSAYVLKDFMANPVMVIFVYPVVFLFSVLFQYGFIQAELYQLKKIDQWLMWTVISTICGNVVGIILVAALGRVREGLRAPFRPVTPRRV